MLSNVFPTHFAGLVSERESLKNTNWQNKETMKKEQSGTVSTSSISRDVSNHTSSTMNLTRLSLYFTYHILVTPSKINLACKLKQKNQ